ncbi:transposable element Tcb1 transposase [Trichonephila clavipes]|nr:transposable element Tcb1 transposase [Trichonephila clavipes]
MKEGYEWKNGMKLSLLTSHASVCNTTMGGIGYPSRTPLVRIAGILNSQCYISEVLEPVVLPYLQGLATAIFQQDNARPHMVRIVQRFFVNHQFELLPWLVRSPDFLPIENMWSMVAERLTQITPPAATPDQLWQRVEAAWSAVTQEHIQCLFESMCQGMWRR